MSLKVYPFFHCLKLRQTFKSLPLQIFVQIKPNFIYQRTTFFQYFNKRWSVDTNNSLTVRLSLFAGKHFCMNKPVHCVVALLFTMDFDVHDSSYRFIIWSDDLYVDMLGKLWILKDLQIFDRNVCMNF